MHHWAHLTLRRVRRMVVPVESSAHDRDTRCGMSDQQLPRVLQIKKYPNRRFYDATRGRHVTLQDVHTLVRQGHDVVVTDSRSGVEITNCILLQLILGREEDKVDLLPTSLLTAVLRNEREVVRDMLRQPFLPEVEEVSAAPLSCAASAG